MEKNFTFRFYEVSRKDNTIPTMVDMLRDIDAISDRGAREKLLSQDYTIRLENFEDDGPDAVVGELIRCQNTNLPAEITKAGRTELSADRLGHSIVFRLNHKKGILGVQYDVRVVSPGRILDYIAQFNSSAIYSIAPVIDKNAWKKFNSGPTKKLAIRIANPSEMQLLSGSAQAASKGFRSMGEAYEAPSILVEISMGRRKGVLASAVTGLADALSKMASSNAHLDKLTAVTVVNDETETIDLIEERVVAKERLQIHDKNPDVNWQIKRNFLCSEMKKLVG